MPLRRAVRAQRLGDLDAQLARRASARAPGRRPRSGRRTPAAAGRTRRSCRFRSAPGRSRRGPRAAAGSPAPGSGSATGSRRRGGPAGAARTVRGRRRSSFRTSRQADASAAAAAYASRCALCRSPWSDPSPLTPSRPSRASATACSAAPPSTSRSPPRSSPRPASSGPVGDDFGEDEYAVLHNRGVITDDVEHVPGGKTFFWAGRYERDVNIRHTLQTDLNVFEHFEPKLSRRLARRRRAVPGQHPARPAARGARAVHRRALRGAGHDEPVDRHRARVAGRRRSRPSTA